MMATPEQAFDREDEILLAEERAEHARQINMEQCPFCDGNARFERVRGRFAGTEVAVVCGECGASGPSDESAFAAADKWDRRGVTPRDVTLQYIQTMRLKARREDDRPLAQLCADMLARLPSK